MSPLSLPFSAIRSGVCVFNVNVQAPIRICIAKGRLGAARRRNTPVFTVFDNISTDINCTAACWYFGNSALECVNKSADFAFCARERQRALALFSKPKISSDIKAYLRPFL